MITDTTAPIYHWISDGTFDAIMEQNNNKSD